MATFPHEYIQPNAFNFEPGSTVECKTCLGEIIKGEVVAFDYQARILVLKSSVVGVKSKIQFVNLKLVHDVAVLKEQTDPNLQSQTILPLPHLNFSLIERRTQEELERRRRSVCSASVSPEGQRIFIAIRKTIEEIHWDGDKIIVLGRAIVQSPYRSENVLVKNSLDCTRNDAENTAQHVRKIIDKFWTKEGMTDSGERVQQMSTSSSTQSFTKNLSPMESSGHSNAAAT